MTDDDVMVRLVGGPADWSGQTLRMPRGSGGAHLISSCPPSRGEGEDPDPRAVYEPGADPEVWTFRGWVPSSPTDPAPEDYQRAEGAPPTA